MLSLTVAVNFPMKNRKIAITPTKDMLEQDIWLVFITKLQLTDQIDSLPSDNIDNNF